MDSTVSFLDIVNEEQKVMGESKEFDSENLFFVGKTDNGADISCKSAEEFQNSYLTYDHQTKLYRVSTMSYICKEFQDYDCYQCIAIQLCSKNDINDVIGYLIFGNAKKWDISDEKGKEISKKVRFIIGEQGIPIANTKKQKTGRAFTTDSYEVFMLLAKFDECVIYDESNDSGFYTLDDQLDEEICVVMVGDKAPQANLDLFISLRHKTQSILKKEDYNFIIKEMTNLKELAVERLLLQNNLGKSKSIKNTLITIPFNSIETKQIQWLWKYWLPLGKLILFAGESGTGKTNIALSLAATISKGGSFADGSKCELPGQVLIYSAEDSASDTIKPRLMSYGADDSKISIVEGARDTKGNIKPFGIDEIASLYDYAEKNPDLRLIIFDPIVSLLNKDMNQANYVRQALEPLLIFAEKCNCTVLCITHLTKAKRDLSLKDRVIGSQAFTAVARFVLATSKPSSSDECYFSVIKSNISQLQDINLGYRVNTTLVDTNIETSTIDWLDPVYGDIDELGRTFDSTGVNGRSTQIDKAKKIIIDKLGLEGTVSSTAMRAYCSDLEISVSTLERAVKQLGIKRFKGDVEWYWKMSE